MAKLPIGLMILPIETKVRDLDARLYLSCRLAAEGFPCVVGAKSDIKALIERIRVPFAFFHKGINKHEIANLRYLKSKGGRILLLDEEGGVYPKEWTHFYARHEDTALEYLDLLFAWGQRQKAALLEKRKNISPRDIVVTGNPRFDLRRKEFDYYYRALHGNAEYQKLSGANFILVNTSFGYANNQVPFEEFVRWAIGNFPGYYDKDELHANRRYQYQVLEAFMHAVRTVAAAHPTVHIVVRPHPAENMDTYRQRFDDTPNVLVTNEGSVQEWIIPAKAVIHHDCTTAIEAFIGGKRVACYAPLLDMERVQEMPVRISDRIEDEHALLEWVQRAIESNGNPTIIENYREKQDLLRSVIANVTDSATQAIIDTIQSRYVSRQCSAAELFQTPSRTTEFFRKVSKNAKQVGHLLLPQKKMEMARRTASKMPYLLPNEVGLRMKLFAEKYPVINNLQLMRLSKNAYLLHV